MDAAPKVYSTGALTLQASRLGAVRHSSCHRKCARKCARKVRDFDRFSGNWRERPMPLESYSHMGSTGTESSRERSCPWLKKSQVPVLSDVRVRTLAKWGPAAAVGSARSRLAIGSRVARDQQRSSDQTSMTRLSSGYPPASSSTRTCSRTTSMCACPSRRSSGISAPSDCVSTSTACHSARLWCYDCILECGRSDLRCLNRNVGPNRIEPPLSSALAVRRRDKVFAVGCTTQQAAPTEHNRADTHHRDRKKQTDHHGRETTGLR